MKNRRISVRAYMLSLIVGASLILTSCGPSEISVNKYDSVHTHMTEYAVGKFKVESEEVIQDTISLVTLHKMDGTEETMDFNEVKELYSGKQPMDAYKGDRMDQNYCNNHEGMLWFALFYSNYGYHLGRPYDVPLYRGAYRTPTAYNTGARTQSRVLTSRSVTKVANTSAKAPLKSTSRYGTGSNRSYAKAQAARSASSSARSSSGSRGGSGSSGG